MSHHYAIFSAHFAPHPGGIETFTADLANQLACEGNVVEVVTMRLSKDDAEREVLENGVHVHRLPCRPLMNGRLPITHKNTRYRALMAELEATGVDRVLVNARFYTHSVEALRFARRIGASAVMLDHGTDYLTLGNVVEDLVLKAYEHMMTAIDKHYRPTFAGISKASTRHLERFGIRTNIVINNAIDAEAFRSQASSRDFQNELGLHAGQKLVAFVGRLTPEKGALPLAQAASRIGTDCVIAMAGEGTQRNDIENLDAPNVHLLGTLERPDLSAMLSQADCFCLPSRSEGFCLALLEAGAWGVPSVITRVGIADELIGKSAEFGILIEERSPQAIADAIERVLENDNDSAHEHLYRTVEENYSWGRASASLDAAFAAAEGSSSHVRQHV